MANTVEMVVLDYAGIVKEKFDLDISEVVCAWIEVYTGDETFYIVYKDGHRDCVTAYSAWQRCFDDEYDVIVNGKWVVPKERFMNRKNSDWHMLYNWGCAENGLPLED